MRINVNVPNFVAMLQKEMEQHIYHNQFEKARERLSQIAYVKETCGGDTYDVVVLEIQGVAVRNGKQ